MGRSLFNRFHEYPHLQEGTVQNLDAICDISFVPSIPQTKATRFHSETPITMSLRLVRVFVARLLSVDVMSRHVMPVFDHQVAMRQTRLADDDVAKCYI